MTRKARELLKCDNCDHREVCSNLRKYGERALIYDEIPDVTLTLKCNYFKLRGQVAKGAL